MKPLLLGYLRVRITTSDAEASRTHSRLVEFADREGFALGSVFREADEGRQCSALTALIDACRRMDVAAVAVPTLADLGASPAAQTELRLRLERETGLPVLLVEAQARSSRAADAQPRPTGDL